MFYYLFDKFLGRRFPARSTALVTSAGHQIRIGPGFWFMLLVVVGWVWMGRPAVAQAQNGSGIISPVAGESIGGVVLVQGTATDPDFLRYELAFWNDANPGAGWVVFGEGDQPVVNGTLAIWDTTVGRNVNSPFFPDGTYQLRLRVVRRDSNFTEYFVTTLLIANDQPTVEPTSTPLGIVTPAPTLGVEATPPGIGPGALPTLTPFPTVTPRPTIPNAGLNSPGESNAQAGVEESASTTGVLDFGRFSAAFGQGMRFTFLLFGGLAVYMLARAVLRGIWRFLTTNF